MHSVGREEAALALGLTLAAAAFHLDRLVEAGVLAAEYYRRPPGRSGPGAGRPAKRYRAVRAEYLFSVPERRYEIIAAVLSAGGGRRRSRLDPHLQGGTEGRKRLGRAIGTNVAPIEDDDPSDAMTRIADLLAVWGYEPRLEPGCLTTMNCPFAGLVEESGDLVCRVNLRLLKGVLKGAGATRLVTAGDLATHDVVWSSCPADVSHGRKANRRATAAKFLSNAAWSLNRIASTQQGNWWLENRLRGSREDHVWHVHSFRLPGTFLLSRPS